MNKSQLANILVSPHMSEKSNIVAEKHRQFVFKVLCAATKAQVKRAVELMFNVKVSSVNILNVRGKTKSYRQKQGKRRDWRKAYVTLEEGYDIEFMSDIAE